MELTVTETLERLAPAKINLALHVTGRRADGYHLLETMVAFAGLGDRIGVSPAASDRVEVGGPFAADVPRDGSNLVVGAREALRQAYGGRAREPVAVSLDKRLPVASGIGGGSSDAAAALSLLARFWRLDADARDLARIGLGLGADVPMCLAGGALIARGIGEEIEPLPLLPDLAMVLVNPGVAVATAEVFAALERRDAPPLPSPADLRTFEDVRLYLAATRNDLQAPAIAIAPRIADALEALGAKGAAVARMSGSGATCFGLFAGPAAAAEAARAISRERPGWFVAATTAGSEQP